MFFPKRTHDSLRQRKNNPPLFSTESGLSKFVEKFCCTPKCLHRKVPKSALKDHPYPSWSKLLTQTSCTARSQAMKYITNRKTNMGTRKRPLGKGHTSKNHQFLESMLSENSFLQSQSPLQQFPWF